MLWSVFWAVEARSFLLVPVGVAIVDGVSGNVGVGEVLELLVLVLGASYIPELGIGCVEGRFHLLHGITVLV